MAKDRYGLWSPHRDSSDVLTFRALLSLRPDEPWTWHNSPEFATWWVIDGSRPDVAVITEMLRAERAREATNGITHGAILANDWTSVSHPIWTFFKVPLKTQLIYNWVDSTMKRMGPAATSFRGKNFRLRRWPNMSRYSRFLDTAQSMSLIMACAQALKNRIAYNEMLTMVGGDSSTVVDSLLSDALQDGILELDKVEIPEPSVVGITSPACASRSSTMSNSKGWSLVRRLIEKFS
jgi:hypothetical protein